MHEKGVPDVTVPRTISADSVGRAASGIENQIVIRPFPTAMPLTNDLRMKRRVLAGAFSIVDFKDSTYWSTRSISTY